MLPQPTLSIIIPTLNEAKGLNQLLRHLQQIKDPKLSGEIIVVDGGSKDRTQEIARRHGARVLQSSKGRAKQMNFGAQNAKGQVFYFLHADTYPPKGFDQQILQRIAQGMPAGCFRLQFDTHNPVLRFFAYLTRINHKLCRGGDQSLFISKSAFMALNGFNEDYMIYEDLEFIGRLYKTQKFTIIPKNVISSARKYREIGWVILQYHYGIIHLKHYLGADPQALYQYYQTKVLKQLP